MTDGGMTPEEYARFMGVGDDDGGGEAAPAKVETLPQKEVDYIRTQLKQCGVSTENIDKVMAKAPNMKKGDQLEFNFIRGHVRRLRLRRETSGKVTLIVY